MRKEWKLAASGVLLLGASTTAWGVACLPGTLDDYFGMGTASCTVGSTAFSDFASIAAPFTAIDPLTVSVTPTLSGPSAGFLLGLNSSAGAGEVFELFFSFRATGGPGAALFHTEAELTGSSVTPDGAVTLVDDLCLDGDFLAAPLLCTGDAQTLIPFDIGIISDTLETLDFTPVSFITSAVDIVVDGGPADTAGTAALQSATLSFTTQAVAAVPEPASLALAGIGFAAFGWARARARRV